MGGADADSLDGGAGNDTADYSDGGTWVLDLSAGTATSGATVEAVSSIENIKAGGGADTLIGDAGDNILTGGYGSDLYRYGQGGGYDEIVEVGFSFDTDTLELVGLNEADVVVSRTSSDLILTTVATGETITVTGHFWDQQHGIETLRFADGTEWGRGTMAAAAWYRGTDGDDTITGTSAAETFDGGAGDDLLNGGSGNDRYVWGQGSGNDTIAENAFSFDTDTLELVGLNADDVVLERSIGVPHLSVTILATGETISVSNHFWGKKYGIEQIHFADGTIWDQGTISNNTAFLGTAGDDTFVGGSAGETVFGLGGDDFLDGKGGDDQLFGGTGADTLWADAGTDTLTGGLGNDHLDGSAGSDIYVYNRGDGDDVIADYRWYDSNDSDRIVFTDIASNEVAVSRADGGSDLLLIVGGATPGSIWVNDHFQSGHSIELFEFADGVTMTLADMAAATADTMAGSSADDTMVGSSINDTFYGLDGDDALDGMGGADQLLAGSGDDMLTGGGGDDLLSGGTGADTFIFGAGFGNDIITDFEPGTGGSDVIEFDDGLFDDFADLLAAATQVGDDVVITWDADNVVTLKDVDLAALHQEDFQFAA
jgi:Ca2+-binding RTX toxin-like protein